MPCFSCLLVVFVCHHTRFPGRVFYFANATLVFMTDIKPEHIQEAVTTSGLQGYTGSYVELGGGEVNDTFLLDCNDRKVILRITRYHDVINLEKEARTLQLLNLKSVPKLLFHDKSSRIFGRAWILETYVEGVMPVALTNEQYGSLGVLLAKIHKVKHTEQTTFDLWSDFLYASKRFGSEDRLMNHPDSRMKALINKAKPYLIDHTERFGHVQESLVHGDVTPSNILVLNNEVGLIDWEFSRFKDPMSDFSTAFYEDMEFNKGKWRVQITKPQKTALYDGYRQAGGVINEERITMWMNHDKLGAAVYLWWLTNDSGRTDHSKAQRDQYILDLEALLSSLERNFI